MKTPRLLRGGELAAVPVQPVEGLQHVDQLPRLARAQDGGGEADRVEGDVVLAHELDVADVVRALVGRHQRSQSLARRRRPTPGWRRCIRSARRTRRRRPCPRSRAAAGRPRSHRHAPGEVAGDAAVDQPLVEVLVARSSGRSVGQSVLVSTQARMRSGQLGLQQVEVAGLAHLDVRSSRRSPNRARSGRPGRAAGRSCRTGRRAPAG